MISVLCVDKHSNYKKLDGLDLWDAQRDAYNYTGTNPVITHPPCQQWSKLHKFAHVNAYEKALAFFCLEKVQQNGGILEHPQGSSFFKAAGIKPTLAVDQSLFGFPARKRTLLYIHGYKAPALPLCFDVRKLNKVELMSRTMRSRMTVEFCEWLVNTLR
jgi:hypothetical protein